MWLTREIFHISYLIDHYTIKEEGAPVLDGLDNMSDWELIGFQKNTANGFTAMAFKDPNSNEQVYLFRGTENVESLSSSLIRS